MPCSDSFRRHFLPIRFTIGDIPPGMSRHGKGRYSMCEQGKQQLWDDFKHTGSVADYLRFKQQAPPPRKERGQDADDNAGAGAPGSKIS